jgi:hypothetical protein
VSALGENAAKLDPFQSKILRKLDDLQASLDHGFWDSVVKESFNTILLCLECLVMDHAGPKILEQLRRESKIYLYPLINTLRDKGIEISSQNEIEKLRYFRNKIEHEHEEAEKHDAEWAYEITKSFVSQYYPEIISALKERKMGIEISRISKEEKVTGVKVADEVWIACALLHKENPDKEDFSVGEILEKIRQENIFGKVRPGIYVHLNLHCVANKAPNPAKYRMLYETKHGRRRLFRSRDYYHLERNGGKVKPNKHEIPEKYWYLLDWYETEYDK